MLTIQEYFNQHYQENDKKIFLEGDKIGEIGGNTLIIEDFKQLEYIYISDLPNLTKLTIKDCGELKSLELQLDKEIEIKLMGDFSKLNNIKTTNNQQQPIIINKEKECNCGGIRLVFEIIIILLNIMLLAYIFYEKTKERKKQK